MRRIVVVAGLATSLFSAVPALADDCGDADSQSAMTACYGNAFKAADKALNATYGKIEHRLRDDLDTKKLLVTAERAWVAFRDADCDFSASGAEGGTEFPMTVSICMTDLTEARTAQLAAFLNCQEGDISCPVPGE